MIAKAKFLDNWKERDEAEKMGYDKPEEKFVYDNLGFKYAEVETFHKTDKGEIRIYMRSGTDWVLKFDENIWNKLEAEFKEL